MTMPRGLHPKTLLQRAGRPGHWSVLLRTAEHVEHRDAPMRSLAKGLAATVVVLLLIVVGVLTFAGAIRPRTASHAAVAEARFHPAGPPLLASPEDERLALERAHAGPDKAALERAMDAAVRQGWGDTAPPPGRADVAMSRAKAGQ